VNIMTDINALQELPELEPLSLDLPGLSVAPPCTKTCSTSCTFTCGSASCGWTTVAPK
jgi:hypothetical protein